MVATRKFDEETVLQKAMEVFWRQGYEATSIDDLVHATGLKRGSLYNAFQDKEGIFLLALDRYLNQVQQPFIEALSAPRGRDAIAAMFDGMIATLADPHAPPGCFIANTVAEAGARSDRIGGATRRAIARLESALHERLLAAQAAGEIAPGRNLRALARFFTAVSLGLPLMQKISDDPSVANDIVATALSVMDRS